MISLDVSITGSELGSKLIQDCEEMAYALKAMAEDHDPRDFDDIFDYIPYGDAKPICEFLEGLLGAIKAGTERDDHG